LVKVVLHRQAGAQPFRVRRAQAVALFFLGFAVCALLVLHLTVFLVSVVVAALAAAWDMGWRVFARDDPPQVR
jgi:4-hydroxybenzoate polyprenyltransferase